MLTISNVGLSYGSQKLFDDVNIKFTPGNCYGIIGANGAGKSTFLKILSGEIEPDKGDVSISQNLRMAVLKQNHFEYNNYPALNAVIMGNEKLYKVSLEREALYETEDFSEEFGIRAAELEGLFSELGGWEAESQSASILKGLGIPDHLHNSLVRDLEDRDKVKVLLAQALFGNPDVLLLDEPTNHLDIPSICWLENFIQELPSIVIVVSHDRHFLNKVCTHIADIDFKMIKIYVGNYDFWKESSDLALRLRQKSNQRVEDKRKELAQFIARFSANASKAKQATSRSKLLEKLTLEEIQPSSRKYPYINFTPVVELGKELLYVENLSYSFNGVQILKDISFHISPNDKIAVVGEDELLKTAFVELLAEKRVPESGLIKWGVTVRHSLLPKDNSQFFDGVDLNLVEWMRQYAVGDKTESAMRGFLGRMLFSGDEVYKKVNVLSGGEKVRCMVSRMMLLGSNTLLLDGPTNHLDLEAITSFNDALIKFKGSIIMISHDHHFIQTVANRVFEITSDGRLEDYMCTFDEYLEKKELVKF